MTPDMFAVLALTVAAIILFATERLPADLVALIVMAGLLMSGLVAPHDGIAGFSNSATVTIGAMLILSAGLFRTGAVNALGIALVRLARRSFWLALAVMMVTVGALSAFMNDTAVVALFLPIVVGAARDMQASPSKLLIPLSFASMFGGACTLIGTSTNILISSIAERHGKPPFAMFELAPLGLVLFGLGFLFMLLIGVRLLPGRRPAGDLALGFALGEYLTEVVLLPEAKSVGKPVAESPLVRDLGIEVLEVIRDGARLYVPAGNTVLRAHDVLRVRCGVEKIKALQEREGIALKAEMKWRDRDLESEEVALVEAVVAPHSVLAGRTLKEMRFRDVFGGTVLALRHRGTVMQDKPEDTRLYGGDALLIQVRRDRLEPFMRHSAFVLVSEVGLPTFRREKLVPALAIFAAVVLAAVLDLAPIMVSAVVGCVGMVLAGCLTLEEAYEAIEWKVIFLLAGVLTLGTAMEKTGAALFLAELVIASAGPWGPGAIVATFYGLTALLTATMSSKATAAILAPVAIATADALGVDARPFLLAVAFAASGGFITPIGYPTNMLIYGPGQYTFADFAKVGIPLTLLFWAAATLLIPRLWPL